MMKFDILTLFPHFFESVMGDSIIGRAQKKGILEINAINIRDFSKNKHKKVDDYPYGGGCGMVMSAEPIYGAYLSIINKIDYKPRIIYLSPQGKVFNQDMASDLKKEKHIVLLCGHYEGIDERIIEEIVDEEISIGDYVLTGGEIPAMVLIDVVSRLIPGVLSEEESFLVESHTNGLLEYPQYTRPEKFLEKKVPEVLLSGHHAKIEEWRRMQSLARTYLKRKDLFDKLKLSEEELICLKNFLSSSKHC